MFPVAVPTNIHFRAAHFRPESTGACGVFRVRVFVISFITEKRLKMRGGKGK